MDKGSLFPYLLICYMVLKEIEFKEFPTHVKVSKTKAYKENYLDKFILTKEQLDNNEHEGNIVTGKQIGRAHV